MRFRGLRDDQAMRLEGLIRMLEMARPEQEKRQRGPATGMMPKRDGRFP
jgi:hypothetical protein